MVVVYPGQGSSTMALTLSEAPFSLLTQSEILCRQPLVAETRTWQVEVFRLPLFQ
jgi:hypothetical protein